ncbi:hypothetical protein G3I34_04290 [Streptomyces sp. SID8014]|uniref:hypothetical protein n=1 Tax=Streptomyces TaxID=1883 RepID=UPI0013B8806D|nr:hypothetical protein [Streptomyces sp. SID8014]NEC11536.1 hypothetical protein [Streptomyces sp. SID8014]
MTGEVRTFAYRPPGSCDFSRSSYGSKLGELMAEVVSVVVVEDDISGELTTGTPVAVTGLIAKPWENEFNGQKKHGISFRAAALTSLAG